MIDIAILAACRASSSGPLLIERALSSLIEKADDPKRIEFLIKLDDDDPRLQELQALCLSFAPRTHLRVFVTSRAGGYADLNKAYNEMLRVISPEARLYWVISDDFEILTPGWDSTFLSKSYPDGLFMLHFMSNALCHALCSPREAIEGPDCYPVWSKKWIALQGGFGHVFATDGWTSLLRQRLKQKHGVDRSFFINVFMKRHESIDDFPGSERWNGVRKETLDLMVSEQMLSLADTTAQSFVDYIAMEKTRSPSRSFRLRLGSFIQKTPFLYKRANFLCRLAKKLQYRVRIP